VRTSQAYLILGLVLVAASAPHQLLLLLSCPIIRSTEKRSRSPDDYREPIAIASKWYS